MASKETWQKVSTVTSEALQVIQVQISMLHTVMFSLHLFESGITEVSAEVWLSSQPLNE